MTAFSLGDRIVATPGAIAACDRSKQDPSYFLARHQRCDWGDVPPEDAQSNNDALQSGGRLLSAYHTWDGEKLWVITEADRSSTTILLPDEY